MVATGSLKASNGFCDELKISTKNTVWSLESMSHLLQLWAFCLPRLPVLQLFDTTLFFFFLLLLLDEMESNRKRKYFFCFYQI